MYMAVVVIHKLLFTGGQGNTMDKGTMHMLEDSTTSWKIVKYGEQNSLLLFFHPV
jgi:hypothetical protein